MDARIELLNKFIKSNNILNNDMHLIDTDASFRKYYRLSGNNTLIMDAPYESGESVKSFHLIDKILLEMGISVPVIHSIDENNGFILLEDLGDQIFSRILNDENEYKLYQNAIDVLAHIYLESNEKKFNKKEIPFYSIDKLLEESNLFCDWFMEKHCQIKLTVKEKLEYQEILKKIFQGIDSTNSSLVLRDYHVDNLILLKDRKGKKQVGVIDFQDAVIGANSYDLVSLLEDVRRPITEDLKEKLIEEYIHITCYDPKQLLKEMRFFSVQRNLKIIGIFSRLKYRDQKPKYMKLIKNAWNFIDLHLEDPNFTELKSWISVYKNKFL
tara:strand:+ start:900 stop:1877 length:978 start_codon:yes stop_codon:yes gene_type:complete